MLAVPEYGVPSEATYSASKFFVRGFTEALNIEWERHDIHVCDVCLLRGHRDDGRRTRRHRGLHRYQPDSRDVAKTIVQAAENRTQVHWVVDTTKLKPSGRL